MPAKRKATSKVKRKAKAKAERQRLIITLSENGAPRRRAEIMWPAKRAFTLNDLAKYRDCGRWHIPPGWLIRITNGKETHETKKTT
jgi:hypothetical protein